MSIQTRPDAPTTAPPATAPRQRMRRRGRAAAVAVATTVCAAGLTVLVLGVAGGAEKEVPPSPGIPPAANVGELPARGLDQRLHNLAEQRGAQREGRLRPEPGADQRLHNLAERHAAEPRALPE